jgi:formylglycine-generating enzyme required for sulfatase activity
VNDGYSDTVPVGVFPLGISTYGALDMSGNVWEWVADWYDENYYVYSPLENPQGPESGERKVLRGGSWTTYLAFSRTSARIPGDPVEGARHNVGFRCAMDAE